MTDILSLRELLVREARWEADGVMSLVLCDPQGAELAPWEPGAHIDLILPSGLVRQYSLCGDVDDKTSYRIAVLREPASRGGSREIFETPLVGRMVGVRGPRNHFELIEAPRYVFVAGGIGITPIIPMIQTVERAGLPWSLTYGGRTRSSMAFLDDLAHRTGGTVEFAPEDERGLLDLRSIVLGATDAVIYTCGPPGLLNALEQTCGEHGAADALHLERFTVEGTAPSGVAGDGDEYAEFEVQLVKSGRTVVVPADRTILDAVRDAVPSVMFSCQEGYCGACEVRVLEGVPDHRDTVLSERERAESKTMMICVSRSKSARLVLDA